MKNQLHGPGRSKLHSSGFNSVLPTYMALFVCSWNLIISGTIMHTTQCAHNAIELCANKLSICSAFSIARGAENIINIFGEINTCTQSADQILHL